MIGLPVVAAVLVVRRRRLPRSIPGWAALFYLLNPIVNVPLVAFVWPTVLGRGSWATLAATCLTYGVCEELARWCSFRFVPALRRHRDESGALAAGLGHGGAESVLFGLQLAAGLVLATTLPGPGTLGLERRRPDSGVGDPRRLRILGRDGVPGAPTLPVRRHAGARRHRPARLRDPAGGAGPVFEVMFDVVAVGALLFIATATRRRLLAPAESANQPGVISLNGRSRSPRPNTQRK